MDTKEAPWLTHFLNVPGDIVKSVYQEEYANKYFARKE